MIYSFVMDANWDAIFSHVAQRLKEQRIFKVWLANQRTPLMLSNAVLVYTKYLYSYMKVTEL